MKKHLTLLALLWFHATIAAADEPASLVSQTTIAVVKINVAGLEFPEQTAVSKPTGVLEPWLGTLQQDLASLEEIVGNNPLYVIVDLPYSSSQATIRIYLEPNSAEGADLATKTIQKRFSKEVISTGKLLGFSPTQSLSESQQLTVPRQTDRPQLTAAMESVKGYPVQILFIPPDYLWRTFNELMPELPTEFGGGPIQRLTEGVQWSAVGIEPKTFRLHGVTQATTADAAGQFEALMPGLLQGMISLMPEFGMEETAQPLKTLVSMTETKVVDDRLISSVKLGNLANTVQRVANMADNLLAALAKKPTSQSLKQIGLAIHNYADANGSFPPGAILRDEGGKPRLSWRVAILPYIEQAELYNKFKLDEPWDSPHNIGLLDQMPEVFKSPNFRVSDRSQSLGAGFTTFLAPVGEGTIFGGDEIVKYGNVRDGLSNTAMVAQVQPELAVPWTAPQDYAFNTIDPFAGLMDQGDGTFAVLLGDGAQIDIPNSMTKELAGFLFTMDDGQVITW